MDETAHAELPSLQLDVEAINHGRTHRRQIIAEAAFLLVLVAAGFVVRLWPLTRSHFWDETVYLQDAEVICCGKTNYSELSARPPLLSLLFAGVFLLWHDMYAASVATALLNALGPAFLYLSGRILEGRVAAAIASLLLAFSPFFVTDYTGNSLLSDCPAVTLILLAFWLLLRALRKPSDLRFAGAGLVLALAVLMRFASLPSVGMLSLLVLGTRRRWRAALACGAGVAAGLGPYLCWSRIRYGGFLQTFRNGWTSFAGQAESPLYFLKNFGDIFPWITLAGLALWIGREYWERWREKGSAQDHGAEPVAGTRSGGFGIFLWVWGAALLVFFSALRHKEPRFIVPLAPPLFLLAGGGLSVLWQGRRAGTRLAGAALLAGALTYTFVPVLDRFQSPFINPDGSDEMDASDFLNQNVPPGTVLYTNFNNPVFGYYTNLPIYPLPDHGPELYDELKQLPRDGVVIVCKDAGEDPGLECPRLEWLDANPHFHRLEEFDSLWVYQYRVR